MFISFYLGNLYFANVKMSDASDGNTYVCIVSNNVVRGIVTGDAQVIQPFLHSGNDNNLAVPFRSLS